MGESEEEEDRSDVGGRLGERCVALVRPDLFRKRMGRVRPNKGAFFNPE